MNDPVFNSFLEGQREAGIALQAESDVLRLLPMGGPPPQHYLVSLLAAGLVLDREGRVVEAPRADFGIHFADDHLRCVESAQVLAYLGPHGPMWHPNVQGGVICVHFRPAVGLVDILHAAYDLWTWQLLGRDDGLNPAAAQWARNQAGRFPIDRRPLRRRRLAIQVTEVARKEGA